MEPAVQELLSTDPNVEVVWRAFELRPEPVPTLDPRGDYLKRAWRDSVYPLAERLGVTMRLPPVQPRSRHAHEAAHWARSRGRFDDYNAALFRAFFERGEDIGQTDMLLNLASNLQLDADDLRLALERGDFRQPVLDDERLAEELELTGVPALVADRRALLFGVQSAAALIEMVARVRASNGRGRSQPLQHLPLALTRRKE